MTVKIAAILAAIGAAILTGIIAYAVCSYEVGMTTRKYEKALTDQKNALLADCSSDKSLTSGADNAIFTSHNLIDTVLDDRLRDPLAPACLSIAGDTGGPVKATSNGNLHGSNGQSNGVSRAELYRIAADADKALSDLRVCRKFVDDTWAAKGQ